MNILTSISLIFSLLLALTRVGPSTCDSVEDGGKNPSLKNDSPTKIFAAYRESYITKNDAKKFRQRIKNHKKPYQEQDYEDLIQEIHYKPKQQPKQALYEKKYFDYLPADMLENAFKETKGDRNTDATKVEFMEIEDFARLHQARNKSRRTNSRRMRRQANVYPFGYSQEILYHTPVVYHAVPHPIYHRAIQPGGYLSQPNLVQAYVPVVADWGKQPYLPPRPDRGYLPTTMGSKKPMKNPGEPSKNPIKKPSQETDGNTVNRFDLDGMEVLVFENAKDDRPKFSRFPGQVASAPARSTTRKPGRTPPPSIFHNSNDYDDDNTVVAEKRPAAPAAQTTQRPNSGGNRQRPTTRKSSGRTPPPLIHSVDYDDVVAGRIPETTRRPSRPRPTSLTTTTTTPRPPAEETERPSQCTWAIVNCCTNVKSNTRYSCFESHGCSGFFFGANPCTPQLVDAAMEETEKYFT